MNETWNNEYEDEKSISLLDLVFYVLRQWKKMVVVAVIAAIVMVAAGALKSYKLYETIKNAPETVPVEITEAEIQDLNDKLQSIAVYEDNLKAYQTYLDESIMCKLDPNGFYEGSLNYAVPLQSDEEVVSAQTICEAEILNSESYEKVAKALREDAAVSKIGEVIELTAEKAVSGNEILMRVKVTARYDTEKGCQKMLDALSEVVEGVNLIAIREDVEPLEKLSERILFTSDASLMDKKQEILNSKNSAVSNLTNLKNSITENQKQYQAWLEAEEEETPEVKFELSVNWKYVILAEFVGAFCVAGLYGVIYLFSGRIHNKEELESYLRVPVFEMTQNADQGNTPEMLAVLLAGHLTSMGLKKVYLSGSLGSMQAQVMNTLKELLEDKGFSAEVGESIVTDAASLQHATDCGYMVLVEKCYESMEKELQEELSKAMFCGIRVLGVILEK